MYLTNLISSLGLKGALAGEVSFLVVFLLASFALSFALGKHRILVSLLGVYVAYAILNLADFDFLKDPQMKTLLFLAVLVSFVMLFSPVIRGRISGSGPSYFLKVTVGTAIVIGFSLSIILGWYSAKETASLILPDVREYFVSGIYKFLWVAAPVAYLGVVRRRID
ncbi:MAG: hypothetical protein PHF35_02165 [Candidatus Moranbacteria bacterium]|nr:hypothetical protein [Candidatus Moranbacteria bacterium]